MVLNVLLSVECCMLLENYRDGECRWLVLFGGICKGLVEGWYFRLGFYGYFLRGKEGGGVFVR